MSPAVVLRGGNCNNGSKCGPRYLNANYEPGNANANIGASLSYPFIRGDPRPNNAVIFVHKRLGQGAQPRRMAKINLSRGTASKRQGRPKP